MWISLLPTVKLRPMGLITNDHPLMSLRVNLNGKLRLFLTRDSMDVAAQNGYLDIVKVLVKSSTDVNTQNDNEETPLDLACRSGKRDIVIFLAEVMGVGVVSWAGIALAVGSG